MTTDTRKTALTAVIIAIAVFAVAALYLRFGSINTRQPEVKGIAVLPLGSKPTVDNEPTTATLLTRYVNEFSPTPALTDYGWIAHRISFIEGTNKAYIEYTDTAVTLRALVSYESEGMEAKIKVLATFVPDEFSRWQLQHGEDYQGKAIIRSYTYDGDAQQWIRELN